MKRILLSLAVAAAAALPVGAGAQSASDSTADTAGNEAQAAVQLEFVQPAASMTFDGGKLTLKGAPATLFFSDRPERVAGQMKTEQFLELWSQSQDSFKNDPPNAALSVLGEPGDKPAIVELESVSQEGGDLVYTVSVLEGEVPASGDNVTLFIDPWVWHPPYPRGDPRWRGPYGGYCHYSYYMGHGICHW